jgi:hypothetical protein
MVGLVDPGWSLTEELWERPFFELEGVALAFGVEARGLSLR